MDTLIINVASDFSSTPGPRLREEGDHSGQQFREELLEPKFLEARERDVALFIDLDGTEGYGTSFLEESFGGLARRHDQSEILKRLTFKSSDEPYVVEEIQGYIRDARNR